MSDPNQLRGGTTVVLSVLMIVVGIAMIVRTVMAGGGLLASGLILGALFVAAGVGRIYIRRRLTR